MSGVCVNPRELVLSWKEEGETARQTAHTQATEKHATSLQKNRRETGKKPNPRRKEGPPFHSHNGKRGKASKRGYKPRQAALSAGMGRLLVGL